MSRTDYPAKRSSGTVCGSHRKGWEHPAKNLTQEGIMLNKDDIKSIRQADYVVLFYSPDKTQGAEWGIRVGKRAKTGGIWNDHGPTDVTRTIVADAHNCDVKSHRRHADEVRSCVAVLNIYDFEVFPTCVLKQLRAGDEIGVLFVGNNDNGYLEAADLHHDEAWLRIVRNDKVVGQYMLDDSVCANNSARIVRYADSY